MILYFCAILVIARSCFGQLSDGSCPKAPSLENFDVETITGYWYPQQVASDDEHKSSCVYYNLKSNNKKVNATITVTRFWEDKQVNFEMYQINDTSHFQLLWEKNMRPMFLLATNFKNWAIWEICYPEALEKSYVSISTRQSTRNEEFIKQALEALKKIDIGSVKANMKPIDRSKCKK